MCTGLWTAQAGRGETEARPLFCTEDRSAWGAMAGKLGQSRLQRHWVGTVLTPQKQLASLPPPLAAAPVGHLRRAGTVLTLSLGWSHSTDEETEAQRVEATHPKPHRQDLGFKARLPEPRG